MIPSAVAREARENLLDYLQTTYGLTDERLEDALLEHLRGPEGLFRGPYVDVRLPFRMASTGPKVPLTVKPGFPPYAHQMRAFERLHGQKGHQPQHTLVTTGTGSGKTECFLYPLLDHCLREREAGKPGVKAILLYPMNALATDQARRFAKELWDDERLKGKVTAGLYVGGQGSHKIPSREHLVDERKLLRQSPPDILLTNYKMLDFLLLRPEDQQLWRDNGPETLRFLVLDELHTYDGAQGSDVACLIRRLKARLEIPEGKLCCVGTSATIGEGDETSKERLTKFASEIFDEQILTDSVITENRFLPAEALGSKTPFSHHPGSGDRAAMETIGRAGDEWLSMQRGLWFEKPEDLEDPIALGRALKRHEFLHQLLRALDGKSRSIEELGGALASRVDWFEDLESRDRALVLDSFMGLISAARKWQGEIGEQELGPFAEGDAPRDVPFLQVQIQLWMREVRGLYRTLDEGHHFEWQSEQAGGAIPAGSDLDDGAAPRAQLPIIRCRDCGTSGLAAVQREGEGRLRDDRDGRQIGRAWMDRSREARLIMLGHGEGDPGERFHLCPVCLKLKDEPGCDCEAEDTPDTIPIRLFRELTEDKHPRFKADCPECGSDDGLMFLGSRSSSLMSVAVSHLYQTDYNQDRKLLAFVDSVQDASHRAGFFGARTYRFNLRTLVQNLVGAEGGRVALEGVGRRLLDQASKELGGESYAIPVLMPEDLRQHDLYQRFLEKAGAGDHTRLLAILLERIEQEVIFEYGFSVRSGRSLEKTGCSTVEMPQGTLDEVAEQLADMASEELWFGTLPVKAEDIRLFVSGILQRLRLRGGIHHPNLDRYVAGGGNRFLLSRQQTPNGPIFGMEAVLPRFLQASKPGTGKRSAFDSYLPSSGRLNWYTDWAHRAIGLDPDTPEIRDLIEQALRLLSSKGLVRSVDADQGRRIWGLEPGALEIVESVRMLECDTCQGPLRVSEAEAGHWEGRACTRFRCEGHYGKAAAAPETFYTRTFRSGRVARVFPEEHTGLLERQSREGVEERFKQDPPRPDGPNLLVCTPTLEMGIDIGDLSAVMLCSVPPTTSNYLQRIGRAGRSTGNALCLTMATTRPHDLYFHADPKAMMSGAVDPPGCFLDAPEMLKRQYVAHAMDDWARQETEVTEIPRKTTAVLQVNAKFPARFLDFLEGKEAKIADDFLGRFESESLSEQAREDLRIFAEGGHVRTRVEDAFAEIRKERERLARQRTKAREEREKHEKDSDLGPEELENHLRELRDNERVLERLARELGNRYPLNVLTDAGVLPNYAFPEPGVELESMIRTGQGSNATYSAHVYQRPASAAIRELAPSSHFYAEGRRVEVDEIDLGSTAQPLVETWRFCPACNHAEREADEASPTPECPSCGHVDWADVGQRQRMVYFRRSRSLAGRLEAATADDGEERTRKQFVTHDLIDVRPENRRGARLIESGPFGFELLTGLVLREINFGLDQRVDAGGSVKVAGHSVPDGFEVCRDCGRVKPEDPPGPIRHQPTCRSKKNKKERTEHVHLYREVKSEAIRLLLPVADLDLDAQRASFRAALQLGLRKRFGGRAPHLQTKEMSEPTTEGGRRNFIVLFDSVPGGTGFLADLWRGDRLMDVLELALEALKKCPCQDEGKDGCYRCLFAYQSQRELQVTSSKMAQGALEAILAQRDKLVDRDSLSDVSMESALESELEEKFLRALLHRVRKTGDVRQYLEKGQKRWELTLGEQRWAVVPQVPLGKKEGVQVPCRPDFLLMPLRPEMDQRKIAIFCDGFAYHVQPEKTVSRIGDDLHKRRHLIESPKYLVWSLTWRDVQDMEKDTIALTQPLLGAGFSKFAAGAMSQWGLGRPSLRDVPSGEQLLRWLANPDESKWRDEVLAAGAALSVQLQTLADDSRNALRTALQEAEQPWKGELVSEQVTAATGHFSAVHEKKFSAALAVLPTQSTGGPAPHGALEWTVRLYDDQGSRKAKDYEQDWRRFLQALNLLQFAENLEIVSTELISGGASIYQWTEAEQAAAAPTMAADEPDDTPADPIAELELEGLELAVAQAVFDLTDVVAEPQYEHEGSLRMDAQSDLAWATARVCFSSSDERMTAAERAELEAEGWTVFGSADDPMTIAQAVREALEGAE